MRPASTWRSSRSGSASTTSTAPCRKRRSTTWPASRTPEAMTTRGHPPAHPRRRPRAGRARHALQRRHRARKPPDEAARPLVQSGLGEFTVRGRQLGEATVGPAEVRARAEWAMVQLRTGSDGHQTPHPRREGEHRRASTAPEQYLRLSDDEMDARIAAAKRTLGDRVVILGHHYQRDEVIKFADYIGDSLKLLARRGQSRRRPSSSSSAASTSWPRAPTSFARRTRKSCCRISPLAARWPTWPHPISSRSAGASWRDGRATRRRERARRRHPRHLHQFVRRDQSLRRRARRDRLHVHQRRGGDDVGVGARREAADASRPASRPQHRLQDGRAARPRWSCGTRTRSGAVSRRSRSRQREADPVERATAPSTRDSPSRRSTRSGSSIPDGQVIAHPECTFDVVQAADAQRLDRAHHQRREGEPRGKRLGSRHRGSSGQPAARTRSRRTAPSSRSIRSAACARRCSACPPTICCGSSKVCSRARSTIRSSSPRPEAARPGSRSIACWDQ